MAPRRTGCDFLRVAARLSANDFLTVYKMNSNRVVRIYQKLKYLILSYQWGGFHNAIWSIRDLGGDSKGALRTKQVQGDGKWNIATDG